MATKPLFDVLYDATDEVMRKLKKPLAARKMKRLWQGAYDAAENEKIQRQEKLTELRKKFQDFSGDDVNKVIELKHEIKKLELQQEIIKDEFMTMFGKELKTDEDAEETTGA